MRQSKLLDVLRRFSSRQTTRFRDFLDSPYFNRSAEISRFWEFLSAYAPDYQDEALVKSTATQRLGALVPVSEKRLSYLMNQLQQLAEEFLAVEFFRTNDLEEALALLQVWRPGDLPRHFKHTLEKAVQALEKDPWRNAAYYLNAFRLSDIRYRSADQNQHQFIQPLQQASDALDDFYLVEKLRYTWSMANLEYMLNLQYDWQLGAWILEYFARENRPLNPTAEIYLAGIRMVRAPDDTRHFFQLKDLLEIHEARFDEPERKYLYTGLLNYCTRRINQQNDAQFSTEYLEINKRLLAAGLLFENGQLAPWRFLNLVNTGLRSGQAGWVQDFIRDYRGRLPADYADDVSLTAQAQLFYHRKDYARAQVLLNQANPKDVLLAVTIRNLLTRIYYERGETELLLSFLEAYRIYLLRQELLSPQMKKQARRFVDFTRKLAKIDRPEAHLLPKLKADLPAAAEIYHRDWLLEQIGRKMAGLF
ncbi:MAG: hypothetical protein IPM81_15035 [Saprospirales bacterium]|nr:hypothetical protein [Saprospirales bacterium]